MRILLSNGDVRMSKQFRHVVQTLSGHDQGGSERLAQDMDCNAVFSIGFQTGRFHYGKDIPVRLLEILITMFKS